MVTFQLNFYSYLSFIDRNSSEIVAFGRHENQL